MLWDVYTLKGAYVGRLVADDYAGALNLAADTWEYVHPDTGETLPFRVVPADDDRPPAA
jgi:hypothetical protein